MRSRILACISLFSRVPLQMFGEAEGFNSVEPAQSILICFASGFMGHAHLRKQVYGLRLSVILPSPTAHNDSDSDIASLAAWLRLGSYGIHWQPGRAGPGGLNLKPRFAKLGIMSGAGSAPDRMSDISQKAMCYLKPQFSRRISYDTPVSINAGGVGVRAALQYAWDSRFKSESHVCFCKMSQYAYIRIYTD